MRTYVRIVQCKDVYRVAQFVEINPRAWRVYIMDYRKGKCFFNSWEVTSSRTFETAGAAMDFCDNAGWKVQRNGVND